MRAARIAEIQRLLDSAVAGRPAGPIERRRISEQPNSHIGVMQVTYKESEDVTITYRFLEAWGEGNREFYFVAQDIVAELLAEIRRLHGCIQNGTVGNYIGCLRAVAAAIGEVDKNGKELVVSPDMPLAEITEAAADVMECYPGTSIAIYRLVDHESHDASWRAFVRDNGYPISAATRVFQALRKAADVDVEETAVGSEGGQK